MSCEVERDSLLSRGNIACAMLSPLTGLKRRPAYDYVNRRGEIMLGVFSGLRQTASDIRDWRFTTYVPYLRGSYLERWLPCDEKQKYYYLDRAYLHLFRRPPGIGSHTEFEILALHCDPNERQDAEHALYKRGPHLHIATAEQPMPHSHFALNIGHLEQVLSSFQALAAAFETAIKMVEEEVLREYRRSPP